MLVPERTESQNWCFEIPASSLEEEVSKDFNGFGEEPSLPFLGMDDGLFYRSEGLFEGFTQVEGLEFIRTRGFYGG